MHFLLTRFVPTPAVEARSNRLTGRLETVFHPSGSGRTVMRRSTLRNWLLISGMAGLLVALSGTLVLAQEPATAPPPAPTMNDVNAAALAGNNAWMLTSSALVLFMTAPGLAMFYGGLVRKKNVLSVIMQCLFL